MLSDSSDQRTVSFFIRPSTMLPSQLLVIGLAGTAMADSRRRRQGNDFALGYGKPGRAQSQPPRADTVIMRGRSS